MSLLARRETLSVLDNYSNRATAPRLVVTLSPSHRAKRVRLAGTRGVILCSACCTTTRLPSARPRFVPRLLIHVCKYAFHPSFLSLSLSLSFFFSFSRLRDVVQLRGGHTPTDERTYNERRYALEKRGRAIGRRSSGSRSSRDPPPRWNARRVFPPRSAFPTRFTIVRSMAKESCRGAPASNGTRRSPEWCNWPISTRFFEQQQQQQQHFASLLRSASNRALSYYGGCVADCDPRSMSNARRSLGTQTREKTNAENLPAPLRSRLRSDGWRGSSSWIEEMGGKREFESLDENLLLWTLNQFVQCSLALERLLNSSGFWQDVFCS